MLAQEDIEKELLTVSRASRGGSGVSQHIMVKKHPSLLFTITSVYMKVGVKISSLRTEGACIY